MSDEAVTVGAVGLGTVLATTMTESSPLAALGPGGWIALGVIAAGVVVGYGIYKMAQANAAANAQTKAKAKACATCLTKDDFPCQELACGLPTNTSPYKGGAHWCMAQPVNDKKDSHHTPAKDAYKWPPPDFGPAIQMQQEGKGGVNDHSRTWSNGSGNFAKFYRRTQEKLIDNGAWELATMMDVAELKLKFGSKYDMAILDMIAYTECLRLHGVM